MKLIKPSFEIWEQEAGLEGVFRQIERAGRVCYKSEDKITETSAKEFVERMIKSGHGAMLEHGTVYLFCDRGILEVGDTGRCRSITELSHNKYSKSKWLEDGLYITTNYRVLVENDWLDTLKYICEPTEYHAKRYTVKFICDRGVSHEFVRHRVFSFAQESTRYCNYSKDKFGNELTYIIPCWINIPEGSYELFEEDDSIQGLHCHCLSDKEWVTKDFGTKAFLRNCDDAEQNYFELLKQGWKPQEARAVLPNSLKTELVVTGFASDWEHFFKLRDAGSAHPQARELAQPLHMEFLRRKYLVNLYDEANPD